MGSNLNIQKKENYIIIRKVVNKSLDFQTEDFSNAIGQILHLETDGVLVCRRPSWDFCFANKLNATSHIAK